MDCAISHFLIEQVCKAIVKGYKQREEGKKKASEREFFNFYVILKVLNWILLSETHQD